MIKPFFTIVIPTLNEEIALPKLLNDLQKQTWQDFEVIHIDGKSDDKTVQNASKASSGLAYKLITCPKRNVSIQRNLGGQAAKGKWIIFVDADTRIDPDFLLGLRNKIAVLAQKNKKIDVFSSLIALNDRDGKKIKHIISAYAVNFVLLATTKSKAPRVFGAMIGVHRDVFKNVNFDPQIKFAEDIDFVKKCISSGGVYRVFRNLKFQYDMRRWDKTNLVSTAVKAVKLQLQLIFKHDFKDSDYDMSGGTNYKE